MDFDIESLLGDAEIEINCPNCSAEIPVKLNDAGNTIVCPKCCVKINLDKDDSFDESMKSANSSLDQLKKTLDNFGK
jgi:uncharacterized paraquat-inducible protein A